LEKSRRSMRKRRRRAERLGLPVGEAGERL
jgi:hypothetical protein